MTWRVADSLEVLRAEVNAHAPNRSTISDGSIGDAAHATRASDHNPWVIDEDGVGVVRARDFTHDPAGGLDCNWLATKLLAAMDAGHPAMGPGAYIIWNDRIISHDRRSEGWRPYSGANEHRHHLHVSVTTRGGELGYDSEKPWGLLDTRPQHQPVVSRFVNMSQYQAYDQRLLRQVCREADRLFLVECIRADGTPLDIAALLPPGWTAVQDTSSPGKAGCAFAYRTGMFTVKRPRWRQIAPALTKADVQARGLPGDGMRTRYALSVVCRVKSTGETDRPVVAHLAPERYSFTWPRTVKVLRGMRRAILRPPALFGVDGNQPLEDLADELDLIAEPRTRIVGFMRPRKIRRRALVIEQFLSKATDHVVVTITTHRKGWRKP